MNKIILVSILHLFECAFASSYDFFSLFEKNDCVQGTVLSMGLSSLDFSSVLLDDFYEANDTMATDELVTQKNALAQINEVAQFNNIKSYYELISEEGPAHKKVFKVSLILGNEYFVGEGTSLKKAKNDAASLALDYTDYRVPVSKQSINKILPYTPVMELNNAALKLGIKVRYEVLDESPLDYESSFSKPHVVEGNQKSYLTRLNYSVYHPGNNKVSVEPKTSGQPFIVRVYVGEHSYLGVGHTIQAAKHDGATKAIEAIKQEGLDETKYCREEGYEEQCRQNKENLKSPISQVYELSVKHNLPLKYEVIEESGKAHDRNFVTRCTLGNLVAEGSGKSKKESKRNASKNILLKKTELPALSELDKAVNALKPKRKKTNKQKKVIKTQIDKLKMNVADMMSSVTDYFSNAPSETADVEEGAQKKSTRKSDGFFKPTHRKAFLTAKDELLRISQSNGIEVQISSTKNENLFATLISVNTEPPHVCFAKAETKRISQEEASKQAINLLYTLGYKIPIIETEDWKTRNNEKSNLNVHEETVLDFNENESDK